MLTPGQSLPGRGSPWLATMLAAINDKTDGATTVPDGAKAYLEHRIKLNLNANKFLKEIMNQGK